MVSVSCFGVRFSVMFHFMFVHYTFSSTGSISEINTYMHKEKVRVLSEGAST